MHRLPLYILLPVLLSLLTCAAPRQEIDQPVEGGMVRWILPATASSFSPFSHYLWDYTATSLIYEGLTRYSDENFTIEPSLAETWNVSEDNKSWTFSLKKGVSFHDGSPFDAQAVVFHFERVLFPDHEYAAVDFKAKTRRYWAMLTIRRVVALDRYTVRFELERPFAFLLDMLCHDEGSIISPSAVMKWGDQVKFHPCGTGPFQLDEYIPRRFCRLTANEHYHKRRPYLDAVEFHARSDVGVTFNLELQSGAVDGALYLGPVETGLKRNRTVNIVSRPGLNQNLYVFNHTGPPLNDKRVRQALRYAFNQESLIKRISRGTNEPSLTILPSPLKPAGMVLRNPYPYNPDKARELLQKAGCELEISMIEQFPLFETEITGHVYYLGQFLDRIGVRMIPEGEAVTSKFWKRIEENDFGIFFTQNFATQGNPILYLLNLIGLRREGSILVSDIHNEDIHALIEEQLYCPGRQDMASAVEEIVNRIEEEAYFIPFDNVSNRAVFSTRLHGFTLHPILSRYNFQDVWKEKEL